MERLDGHFRTDARRPTRIVQFGEGNFLRAFVDWQVQRMNKAGVFDGGVAIVQPLPTGRVAELRAQDGLYTVVLEGLADGRLVRSHELITAVNQLINPYQDWAGFLALADDPDVCFIVSNTTEAGIALDPLDDAQTIPPRGFPAKLTHLLRRRFEAGLPGFTLLPCELVEDNGAKLKAAVLACVAAFGMGDDLASWIDEQNTFCGTLVDRIVPGYPSAQAEQLRTELGYVDEVMVKAEPFMLWVIEGPADALSGLPLREAGLNVVLTSDLRPYHDRKVFLLNGPHTSLAQLARLAGFREVAPAMDDDHFASFVAAEMRDEIFPAVDLPLTDLETFAAQVVERFKNPYLHHRLDDIALNSVSKFVSRLLPVVKANLAAGRGVPPRIAASLAGLLAIYAGLGGDTARPYDMPDVLAAFDAVKFEASGCDGYVAAILGDAALWGEDLTRLPGLAALVAEDLAAIERGGALELVAALT